MYELEFEDQSLATFNLLRQAWTAVNKASEVELARKNMTPEQVAILWACRDYPGKLKPAEVARLTFRENQSIAGQLNRMEKEGLVKRTPKRKGKPFTELTLTPKGEERCGPGIEVMKKVIKDVTSGLSREQHKQLQGLLRGVRDKGLDKLHIEPRQPAGVAEGEAVPVRW